MESASAIFAVLLGFAKKHPALIAADFALGFVLGLITGHFFWR